VRLDGRGDFLRPRRNRELNRKLQSEGENGWSAWHKFSLSFGEKGGIQNGSVCDIHQNRWSKELAGAELSSARLRVEP
jgi:hypothetical protein